MLNSVFRSLRNDWGRSLAQTHITDLLQRNIANYPNKLALVTEDKSLTWKTLGTEVSRAASSIARNLPSTTDQLLVGILLPNTWQFVVSYLAVLKLGHIVVPLDATYKSLEIKAIINQITVDLIITNQAHLEKLDNPNIPTLMTDKISNDIGRSVPQQLRLPANKQIATLVFTSGTTGKPKAAPYTHANHIWNIAASSSLWNWNNQDSLLISLPLSHWYGLVMGLTGALYHGNTIYLHEWFDPRATLEALSSGRVTIFQHVSSIYSKLLEVQDHEQYDLSNVKLCLSGASALPPSVWQEFKNRFGQEIIECYGSSESGRIASNLLMERIPGSPGRPLPGVETKLSDSGELLVRSAGVFPGYWRNRAATNLNLDSDGWWHTGDIADIEDGRIVLKGRKQERIRRFGYTVSPRDIEWALRQNGRIKDVHVLGVQANNGDNDQLIYFVVGKISNQGLLKYCKENLPFAWRPDKIINLPSLPRTRSGKPKLPKLRELAGSAA